jgi:hypothetical protein
LVQAEEIVWLREWIGLQPRWSRKRLARELCLQGQRYDGRGRLKGFAARSLLLKLEAQEFILKTAIEADTAGLASGSDIHRGVSFW